MIDSSTEQLTSASDGHPAVVSGSGRAYPVGESDSHRFTLGLAFDIVTVLRQHGYPSLTGRDLVELQASLFTFLYRGDGDHHDATDR